MSVTRWSFINSSNRTFVKNSSCFKFSRRSIFPIKMEFHYIDNGQHILMPYLDKSFPGRRKHLGWEFYRVAPINGKFKCDTPCKFCDLSHSKVVERNVKAYLYLQSESWFSSLFMKSIQNGLDEKIKSLSYLSGNT